MSSNLENQLFQAGACAELAKSQDSLGRPLHGAPVAAGPLMTLSVISSISDDALDCVGRSDEPADPNRDVLSSATAGGWEGEKASKKDFNETVSLPFCGKENGGT